MHNTIGAVEAKKIMETSSDIAIVDVRDEDELVDGYIENSLLIPLDQIEEEVEKKITDKDKMILVYCRSGRRSAIACSIMDNLGYKNVCDFGGIINWPFEKIM